MVITKIGIQIYAVIFYPKFFTSHTHADMNNHFH